LQAARTEQHDGAARTAHRDVERHAVGDGDAAAREAEMIARDLDDHTLLAFALNGRFMQTFHRAGLAPERARIGEDRRRVQRTTILQVRVTVAAAGLPSLGERGRPVASPSS
jgi:hypothetical protein